jgi:hypothetical protein
MIYWKQSKRWLEKGDTMISYRLQASGFRDGLILHTCEREGPSHWQYHKVVAKLHFMARSGSRSVHSTTQLQRQELGLRRTDCTNWNQEKHSGNCLCMGMNKNSVWAWLDIFPWLSNSWCMGTAVSSLSTFTSQHFSSFYYWIVSSMKMAVLVHQGSGFRDGLSLHTCEREGPSHWVSYSGCQIPLQGP